MRKKALLFVSVSPAIYLYGLAENHFKYGMSKRAYSLEFIYDYLNAWRVLFGKDYKDNSVKVSRYDFKIKVKKAKFDLDIALLMKRLYGSHWIRFNKKRRKLEYGLYSGDSDIAIDIKQLGNDKFKIGYSSFSYSSKNVSLCTDYIFSKQEAMDVILMIKNKQYQ